MENNHGSISLARYNNSWYYPGASALKRSLWMIVNVIFFNNGLAVLGKLKCTLLRLFGATIGERVVIKPSVNIKYPWFLHVGNDVWIGEKVWIDNLSLVRIGNNVCISQGSFLLTGNHDYKKTGFDLIVKPISIEDGVWLGAKSIVCAGVNCKSHSVLAVASVATKDLEPFSINQGAPSEKIRLRIIK